MTSELRAWPDIDDRTGLHVKSSGVLVCVYIPHSSPRAGGAASAEACENRAIAFVLRGPVPPLFELGRPERQPPKLVAAIDRDANARSSFSNDARAAAASLPKANLKMRSCRPPGSRRWKRDEIRGEVTGCNIIAMDPVDVAGLKKPADFARFVVTELGVGLADVYLGC